MPIIPISAQLKLNIDAVVDYLCRIPIPTREFSVPPYMIIIRSFDINHPGQEAEDLRGGVAGGTILKGVLKVGDEIAIRPGKKYKNKKTNKFTWTEIRSVVTSLMADNNALMYAIPGGLIAVGTKVDPQFTRSDVMVGGVIGHPDLMPEVYNEIDVTTTILKRIVGTKSDEKTLQKIQKDETLMINIGSTNCFGTVVKVQGDKARFRLASFVCAMVGDKIALSRKIKNSYRLIGWGDIIKGHEV